MLLPHANTSPCKRFHQAKDTSTTHIDTLPRDTPTSKTLEAVGACNTQNPA